MEYVNFNNESLKIIVHRGLKFGGEGLKRKR